MLFLVSGKIVKYISKLCFILQLRGSICKILNIKLYANKNNSSIVVRNTSSLIIILDVHC
ncbi:MAG: hypothetical protein ACI9L6_000692 [Flavobacterium sp.]|jgi:hypothetical protein